MRARRTQGSGSRFLYEPFGQRTEAELEQALPDCRRNNRAATLWHLYTQAVGITALAAAISFGVIRVLSREGPVVEVVEGPFPISTMIPYLGTLSYEVSTRRLASCDGIVVYSFLRTTPQIGVMVTRSVQAEDMSRTVDRLVHIELPDSVLPGPWRFQATVDSRCPTFSSQDLIAAFDIDVLGPGGE